MSAVAYIQNSKKFTHKEQLKSAFGAADEADLGYMRYFLQRQALPEQVIHYAQVKYDVDCLILMDETPLGSTEEEIINAYERLASSGVDVLVLSD